MSQTRILSPAAPAAAGDPLEIAAIDTQRRRFGWVSLAAIVVSFVHMAAALVLFSSASWYERAAALGMTALVDVATWAVAEYLDYARRRGLARSQWIKVLFGFALLISMFLNGAYLWSHRPPEATLPGWMSAGIAVAFALFVPLLIAVASLARGELTDDRLQLQQGAQQERSALALLADTEGRAAGLEAELRDARATLAHARAEAAQWSERAAQLERSGGDLVAQHAQLEGRTAQLETQLAHARAEAAQWSEEAAQLRASGAQLEGQLAQARASGAQLEGQLAQARAALADLETQLAQERAAGPLDPVRVAQRLIALGESQRRAAEFVGMKESTLRSRLTAQLSGV